MFTSFSITLYSNMNYKEYCFYDYDGIVNMNDGEKAIRLTVYGKIGLITGFITYVGEYHKILPDGIYVKHTATSIIPERNVTESNTVLDIYVAGNSFNFYDGKLNALYYFSLVFIIN